MDLKNRERKIDVEKMTIEQVDALTAQIGQAVGKIMDEANLKCNEILNIYGLKTQINYKLLKINNNIKKTKKASKS